MVKQKSVYLTILFLIVVCLAAFGRIAGNDFINYDDNLYVTENNHVQSGFNKESIPWAATAVVSSNWHPLTMFSHMLDWKLFRANASGHHLVSLLWHIGAVILLFLFLNKTTNNLWPSAFAAAFFALHPLRVESVAWVAERKDVLSLFFAMACLYAYAFYAQKAKGSQYFLCLILFALALMSKPMMVTLPFVLLLLDYWPLNRWPQDKDFNSVRGLIGEKIPFIALTIISSILTFWAQNKGGSIASIKNIPFSERFANAIVSYAAYLWKTIWSFNLAVFYPYEWSLPLWKVLLSASILILITVTVLYYIRKLPFLFVGWFIYLGTLVPVIGLVQVGSQAMADRYTYMPSIGIAFMLTWGILYLVQSENIRKKVLFPLGIAIIIVLSVLTWRQCGYWKNSIVLFRHALSITKDNALANNNLATAVAKEGDVQGAIYHFNEAIHINPDYADAYYNIGTLYCGLGQYEQAIGNFTEAIHLKPDYTAAYNNRAFAYINMSNNIPAADSPNASNLVQLFHLNLTKSGCQDAEKACRLGNCKIWEAPEVKMLCHIYNRN
jgi:protein O-mannosyl-transferase